MGLTRLAGEGKYREAAKRYKNFVLGYDAFGRIISDMLLSSSDYPELTRDVSEIFNGIRKAGGLSLEDHWLQI
jgi:hypothetical protein